MIPVTDVWVRTADGDLLRAEEVRQITSGDGLRVVLVGGSQFVLAGVKGRAAAETAAQDLAAALSEAARLGSAVLVSVVQDQDGWIVTTRPLVSGRVRAS